MKKLILLAMALMVFSTTSFAVGAPVNAPEMDTGMLPVISAPVPAPVTGWGPSLVGSVGAFYFNGNYSLLNAGAFLGTAYTWDRNTNVSSAGIYVGPHSQQVDGVTTTSLDVLAYLDLYKTAAAGSFGVGLGTQFWRSGDGIRAFDASTSFLALGYKF